MIHTTTKQFYTTKDVIESVGISRLTLYRWFKAGKIPEVSKDYKDHRLFTKKDIDNIKHFKTRRLLPQAKKKQRNKSMDFLALAGSWQDARSAEEIIKDIYSIRHENEARQMA